jgi:hypothetical protein
MAGFPCQDFDATASGWRIENVARRCTFGIEMFVPLNKGHTLMPAPAALMTMQHCFYSLGI